MFDTIIVGAGLAGISAGQYLSENDKVNFLILESGSEIGGRIRTIEFQGKLFSIGPGWLHGRNGNPIYDIANELGIELKECEIVGNISFVWNVREGTDVSKEFEERSCVFDEAFLDVIDKTKSTKISPEQSLSEVFHLYSKEFESQCDFDRTVIFAAKEIYMGAPMSDVSARIDLQLDKIYSLDEDEVNYQILDPLGMTKLIGYLSEKFTSKIKLNCKVVSIQWHQDSHEATIILNDGSELNCKNVILTLPCGLLAKNAIRFEPELPELKISAWKHIHSVNYCRLFAKFPRKFWPDNKWLISVIDNVDPFDELILWQNAFKQNLCLEYDNILICHFSTGYKKGRSRFEVEKRILTEIVTNSMKRMFPETYCAPEDVLLVSHWDEERFSGAFSIIAPGFSDEMIEILDKSIGPLHFAGESVSVELTGTMQAAYISGRKAAKQTFI